MKTKSASKSIKQAKEKTNTHAKTQVSPDFIVHQLNNDVRNSVLVVSVLINLFVLISWLVVQVSTRYDAALIYYLQNR